MQHIVTLSLLITAVLVIRLLFRRHISPNLTYALWLLVVVKLCIPFSILDLELPTVHLPQNAAVEQNTALSNDVILAPEVDTQNIPSYETNGQVTAEIPRQNELSLPIAPGVVQNEGNAQGNMMTPSVNKTQRDIDDHRDISPKMLFTILWLIGSATVAIWFTVSVLIFALGILRDRVESGSYKGIRVFVSENAGTPCLFGIIPAIYLTPEACKNGDRELIIEHEYTHLRHGDSIWSLIRVISLILLWWNPLVWAAALLSKQDAELACDYSVTRALDETQRKSYAYMIISLIPKKHTFATGFANNSIKERIIMMTKKHKNRIFATLFTIILAFAAVSCSFIGIVKTVNGKDILPTPEDDFKKLYIYRYDGKNMYTANIDDKDEAAALLDSIRPEAFAIEEGFKHSSVKGDIYGIRIVGEESHAYAYVNGHFITDSGNIYKYDKDIASAADKYFGEEAEGERLTKYFPCLRYIAMDGNSWDLSFMPRATMSERNYQIKDKPFEPIIEHFFGEKIVLYDKCEDGSVRVSRGMGQVYDMHVMINSRWYDVPINEGDYKETEWKSYSSTGDSKVSTLLLQTTVNTCVDNEDAIYGRYSVDIPLDTPDGYYKLNVLGNDLDFSVDQKERQGIKAAGDVDTDALEAEISSLIPAIVPGTEIGDGYNFFTHRTVGMEKEGDILTVYVLGLYNEFRFDGELTREQNVTFPAILKFKITDEGYVLTDKVAAYPWSELEYDMPPNAWISLRSVDPSILYWEAYKSAVEHFGFDPSETIKVKIDTYLLANEALANDELTDRARFVFQAQNCNLELINYGEYTMKYICEQIMSGREMIGAYGDYIKELVISLTRYYNPISDITTREHFYNAYTAAWSMRYADEERTREFFPMMLAITECIKPNSLKDPSAKTNVIKTYLVTSDSEHLFSYTDRNKGIGLEFYALKDDPKRYKVGYYDSEGDLLPSMGNNIVGSYTYDSATPIYAGCNDLELFYILKMINGEDVYYLKFKTFLAAKHNGVNYPHFGFDGEIQEAEVDLLLEKG